MSHGHVPMKTPLQVNRQDILEFVTINLELFKPREMFSIVKGETLERG